jgi:hypothetical protein
MNSFGVWIGVLVVIVAVLMLTRLGRSINSTRRMSGQGQWSADGAEIPGTDPRGHHNPGHHDAGGHHNIGGHDIGGHHNFGGGGGDFGGGHHG